MSFKKRMEERSIAKKVFTSQYQKRQENKSQKNLDIHKPRVVAFADERFLTSAGDDLRQDVWNLVVETLSPARVLDIKVAEGEDGHGNPIYRIDVVLDLSAKQPERSKMLGLVRRLHPLLVQREERRFPVLSFLSKTDVKTREVA